MRDFTTTQLTRMQAAQDAAMQDTCVVLSFNPTTDDWGNPDLTGDPYEAGDAIDCGVEMTSPSEAHGSGDVPLIDAKIRLPIDTSVGDHDRIRVTHRYGSAITAEDYEVVGFAKRGPSGLYLDARRVDDGS